MISAADIKDQELTIIVSMMTGPFMLEPRRVFSALRCLTRKGATPRSIY